MDLKIVNLDPTISNYLTGQGGRGGLFSFLVSAERAKTTNQPALRAMLVLSEIK